MRGRENRAIRMKLVCSVMYLSHVQMDMVSKPRNKINQSQLARAPFGDMVDFIILCVLCCDKQYETWIWETCGLCDLWNSSEAHIMQNDSSEHDIFKRDRILVILYLFDGGVWWAEQGTELHTIACGIDDVDEEKTEEQGFKNAEKDGSRDVEDKLKILSYLPHILYRRFKLYCYCHTFMLNVQWKWK